MAPHKTPAPEPAPERTWNQVQEEASSGVKLFVVGVMIRFWSPNLFQTQTPLVVGTVNSCIGHAVLATILIVFSLDRLTAPDFKKYKFLHNQALTWLNRSAIFKKAKLLEPDRIAVLAVCFAKALGETMFFFIALVNLFPSDEWLNEQIGVPLPLSYIAVALAYAWYAGGEESEAFSFGLLMASAMSYASYAGGVWSSGLANFLSHLGFSSLFFNALQKREKPKEDKEPAEKEKKEKVKDGSNPKKKK